MLLFITVGVAGGGLSWYQHGREEPLPDDVADQLSFAPYKIVSTDDVKPVKPVNYDSSVQLLTYQLSVKGIKVVVSQQPIPANFKDVENPFEQLSKQMNVEQYFKSKNGVVSVTYPNGPNGQQTALLNNNKALLLARPDKNLTISEWKELFGSFSVEN